MNRHSLPTLLAVLLLLGAAAIQQARLERPAWREASILYVPSGEVLGRLALSFDALLADVYWIRAVQHYGSTKLSTEAGKQYDLLYPLLDITTTLDPRFNIAYRFGAIFLAEAYPDGPGRPDLAVALLKKGLREMPDKWEYMQDIGFVHYWWLRDYEAAATWFQRASQIEGSPWWLEPLAASTLTAGGDRQAARFLWEQMARDAGENAWLRREAERRLLQLTALDQIEELERLLRQAAVERGAPPADWADLIRAGILQGVPVDPTGHQYRLDPAALDVTVSPDSPLFPLPGDPAGAAPPAA